MQEKLIIKNFGPIKDVELELGRFNILIGEQATGKSTVAKVLAVCRYFSYIVKPRIGDDNFARGLEAWGLSEFIKFNKTYIAYTCEHYRFEAQSIEEIELFVTDEYDKPDEIPVHSFKTKLEPISESFKKIDEELKRIIPDLYFDLSLPSSWQIPTVFFQNEVASVLDNPFYFPVERSLQSLFSLGKYSTANFYDKLYEYFANVDRISQGFKNVTPIEPLGISYKNENGKGFIKSSKHDFVRLNNAASGYQSTIPVVLVLKNYNRTKKKGKTFIIEEPELNLFPNAQQKLMEYLVEQVNNHNNIFLINTHSPYVLTPLNNLLYAYQVGQMDEEETEKVIPKKLWLNPAETKAYLMKSDGTCESIMDEEEQLIKADKIDEVTNRINQDFEKLLSIQLVES